MHILGLRTDQVIDLADVRGWIGDPRGEHTCNTSTATGEVCPRRMVVCLCGASGRMRSEDVTPLRESHCRVF
jgi:hypothetical protein